MKSFFEEYGFVLLSALVVIGLIGIASLVKTNMQSDITSIMTDLKTRVTQVSGKTNY